MACTTYKGSVTVFLSMLMLLLIGLVMCLIEVTKVHNMKSYRRVVAEGAIGSVFGEYHASLQEEYGLFGLDASYKKGDFSLENVLQQFSYYGGEGEDSEVESLQLMTDNQGAGFLDQVLFYMEDATGMGFLEDILGMTDQWDSIDIEEGNKGESGLSDLGDMKDSVLEDMDNPLSEYFDFDFTGILHLVVDNKDALSDGKVELSTLCSQRQLEVGYGTSVSLGTASLTKKLSLIEYGLRTLGSASVLSEVNRNDEATVIVGEDTLSYQLEYLIGGKNSDQENLKSVVHKLLLIRTPVNYACLQGDSIKKLEVDVLATSIALATGAVGAESIIAESLLWAWSYGESIADIKSLLSGNSLTLVKNSDQWQLDLSGLLSFGSGTLTSGDGDNGMDYEDFLRMLLYLETLEDLTKRAMDMVELGVKNIGGMELFQLDHCISRMILNIETQVGMGYSYGFPIEFGYR